MELSTGSCSKYVAWVTQGSCPGCFPTSFLPNPGSSLAALSRSKRKPCHSASTARQQPKCWRGISTALVTNPTHSTTQDAIKKINSIPTRPSRAKQPHTLPFIQLTSKSKHHNLNPIGVKDLDCPSIHVPLFFFKAKKLFVPLLSYRIPELSRRIPVSQGSEKIQLFFIRH